MAYRMGADHPYHTLVRVFTLRLKDELNRGKSSSDNLVDSYASQAEEKLAEGLFEFPADEKLLEAEAELAEVLKQDSRVERALRDALRINAGRVGAAIGLASILQRKSDVNGAVDVLDAALAKRQNAPVLKIALAEALLATNNVQSLERVRSLASSCRTKNGKQYKAEILYGRALYGLGRVTEAVGLFQSLRRTAPNLGHTWRLYPMPGRYKGICQSVDVFAAASITSDMLGEVTAFVDDMKATLRDSLRVGSRCSFDVMFSVRGAVALNLAIED